MKEACTPKSFLLALALFLLPWQTHLLLFPGTILGGDAISPSTLVKLYAVEIVVMCAALAAVVVQRDRPTIDARYRLPIALACCVFVFATLSTVWSASPFFSCAMLIHLGAALLLFVLLLDKKLALRPLLFAFGWGLVAPSLLGVWQYVVDASPASTLLGLAARDAHALGDAVTVAADGTRQLRAYGSFSHPNIFGGYLAVGVIGLWSVVKSEKGKVKSLTMFIVGLLFVALVFTQSRSAALGLALGVGLAALVRCMKNTARARIAVVPIAMAVIGAALFGSLFAPNIAASIRGGGVAEDRSITERIAQYRAYPDVVGLKWFTGMGIGTYVIAAFDQGICSDWDCQPIHNVPLLIIGEMGIIGALIVFTWSSSIDRINFARFPNRDALTAFAMGNVILVVLFFDHYLWTSWSGLALIAFVMALTVRMGEQPLHE